MDRPGSLRRREHGTESPVGVGNDIRAVADEVRDVGGVPQEVLALDCGALAVTTTVEHQELIALLCERLLRLPLLSPGRQ